MALPKFSQPNIPGGTNLSASGPGAPDQGPIDRPNPLLKKTVYQNDNVFGAPAQNQSGYFTHQVNGSIGYQPPVPTMHISNTSAFRPRPGQPYQQHYPPSAPTTKQMPVQAPLNAPMAHRPFQAHYQQPMQQFRTPRQSPLFQPGQVPKPKPVKQSQSAGGVLNLNTLDWKAFAFNSFLVVLATSVAVTGYFYFTRPGASVSADVAGAATSSEVMANVAEHVVVPTGRPQIYKIDNSDAVKQKDPDFFKNVQSGDYLLIYSGKSVLYRPALEKIIAVTDKEIR